MPRAGLVAPHEVEHLLVAQHLVGVLDKRSQETELERRQRLRVAVDRHRAVRVVDRDGAVVVPLARLLAADSVTQQHLDAREQLLAAEPLRDVVVRAGLQPAHFLQLLPARGQHEHGHIAQIPDPLERGPPVQLGHHHVEHDDIRWGLVQRAQPCATVGCLLHLVAFALEQLANQAANVVLIVDHQYERAFHTVFIPDRTGNPSASGEDRPVARILIGEPVDEIHLLLTVHMRRLGHEPVRADDPDGLNADEADIAVLEPAAPEFLALARTLRGLRPELPLVFVSTEPASNATRELAPVRHILKPFERAQLAQAIEAALSAGNGSHASHT